MGNIDGYGPLPPPPLRFNLSKKYLNYIREQYDPTVPGRVAEIAQHLGCTPKTVRSAAARMGLTHPAKPWTEEESRELEQWAARRKLAWIAERLGRSAEAVRKQLANIRMYNRGVDTYSAKSLAEYLGVHRSTIVRWIEAGILGARRRRTGGLTVYCISPSAVRRFLERHPDRYDRSRAVQSWLADLLAGADD